MQVLHASCRDDLARLEQDFGERTKNWKALLVHKFPTSTTEADFMRLLGPVLIPMMFAFCFISFAFALVSEKAQRMRTVGEMAGLTAGPYWCKPQLT